MADEGISAGSVYVSVVPRVDQAAFQRIGADPSAAKIGDDLGDRIGKAISKRIATSIRDGITAGGAGLGTQGAKAGLDYGDRFSAEVKRRISAALRDLPTPTIGVATTEAEQKIKDLHGQLSTLSARVGVDLSGEDALAEIRRIREELDRLRTSSADVTVRTNAAAAIAELAAVDEAIRKINGQSARVDVNTNADQAASRMELLVSAGLALGPAIVPGAVAAAAAILTIGSAATSAVAGIGVGALAFSGVGAAVKALDTAQQQAAKSGSTLASQQKSLAGGADQVRSAEASLANTRANAAASAARAEQQVTDAQTAALRAQRDLNDAITEETRSRQDLAQSIKGNVLDQEQAALDVAKAKTAYEQQASEQNRISYEQAKLRAQDLAIQGTRLAAQQADANKTSVEGSRRVQDAKAKEVAAQRAVTDAETARTEQARQSAFQIQQASQAVITAQRGIAAATVAAGATGGAAIDALAVSMGNLPVAGQEFARFLFGLKGRLDDLKATAAGGILPGAQQGIQILLPYFGDLEGVVGNVSTEIGSLEVRAAKTFASPFWRSFFVDFLGGQAVPNLELMFQAGINVAEAGARIVQGFSPVERQVGGGLLTLTQRFLAFSQGLDRNQGFQDFVRFAETEVPHVISTVEALSAAGLHIVQAYGPVGSVVVSELRLLSQIINAIPVPVITALAFAITAYKTGALLAGGAQALLNSQLVVGATRMVTYGTATTKAGVTTTAFQRATAGAASFIGGGPFGLAIGIGALALSAFAGEAEKAKSKADELRSGLVSIGSSADQSAQSQIANAQSLVASNKPLQEFIASSEQYGITADDIRRSLTGDREQREENIKKLRDHQSALEDLQKAIVTSNAGTKISDDLYRKAGVAVGTNTDEIDKQIDATYRQRTTLEGAYDQLDRTNTITDKLAGSNASVAENMAVVGKAFDEAGQSAAGYGDSIAALDSITTDAAGKAGVLGLMADKVATSNLNAGDKTKVFGQILADLGSAATDSGPVFDGLAETFNAIATSALSAHDKSQLLKQSLDQMYGAAISQTEAAEAQSRTQDALTAQLGKNSAGFDINSGKTIANRDAIRANVDALEAALQAARDKYVQDIADNVGEDKARETHDKTVQSILDGIPKTQRQTAAVKELVSTYGTIPPDKSTTVTTPGLDKAIDDLITAHAVQEGLDKSWSKQQIADEAVSLHDIVFGRVYQTGGKGQSRGSQFAGGGPVSGPGGPTEDLIPAMLSNDEHVLTAAEVHAAGGHGNVYALREMMLRGDLKGLLPGFATGGAVGFPINIPTNTGAAGTLASLWNQWAAAIAAASAGGTGSADLGIAKTIANVAATLKADRKVLLSAMETALVESGMHNLKYGDRDSLGVFQQRPSQGWGSPAEILNVAHAARAYLLRAIQNEPRFAKATAGQLAQSVQRSAFPGRYDQRAAQAEAIIESLSGGAVGSGIGVSAAGSEQIKAFIRSTDPLPYVFGAAGPKSFDCSGIVSAVYGRMTGRGGGNGQRYFVTQDFAGSPPAGFKPGAGGTLTIGVNPAEHMAGNYGGLGFEARGVKAGILVGSAARKPSTFQKMFHLAAGGPVSLELLERLGLDIGGDPSGMTVNGRKMFDTGGYLPPGLTLADNRTGGLERVLDRDETAAYQAGRSGAGQPPVVVNISPKNGAMRDLMDFIDVRVEHGHDRVASLVGSGVRGF